MGQSCPIPIRVQIRVRVWVRVRVRVRVRVSLESAAELGRVDGKLQEGFFLLLSDTHVGVIDNRGLPLGSSTVSIQI